MIRAIILTYDKQIGLAELLVKKYVELGLSNNIEFLIPINDEKSKFVVSGATLTFVLCESDIYSTMEALLNLTDDDEWVLWAIDDRYPLSARSSAFNNIVNFLETASAEVNGVKLIYWREDIEHHSIDIKGSSFRLQRPETMFGVWHHQFLRARILKKLFMNENVKSINNIRKINEYFRDARALKLFTGIYVPIDNVVEFAEPLYDGKLTLNGYHDLKLNGCAIPNYEIIERYMAFYDCETQIALNPSAPKFVSKNIFD